jgi:hypothetical protein
MNKCDYCKKKKKIKKTPFVCNKYNKKYCSAQCRFDQLKLDSKNRYEPPFCKNIVFKEKEFEYDRDFMFYTHGTDHEFTYIILNQFDKILERVEEIISLHKECHVIITVITKDRLNIMSSSIEELKNEKIFENCDVLEKCIAVLCKACNVQKKIPLVFVSTDDFIVFRNLSLPELFGIKKDMKLNIPDLNIKKYIEIFKHYDKEKKLNFLKRVNSKQQLQFNFEILSLDVTNETTIRPFDPYSDIKECVELDERDNKYCKSLFIQLQTIKHHPKSKIFSFVAVENNNIVGLTVFTIVTQPNKLKYIRILTIVTKNIRYHYFSACCLLFSIKKFAESRHICIISTEVLWSLIPLDFWRKQGFRLNLQKSHYDSVLGQWLDFYLLGFKRDDFLKSPVLNLLKEEKVDISFKNNMVRMHYSVCKCKTKHIKM